MLGLEVAEERPGAMLYRVGDGEFAIFQTAQAGSGAFTQMGFYVDDLEAAVAELSRRGVEFERVRVPGLQTNDDGIADIEGQYPSKGSGERAAWFRDCEGNLLGIGEIVP